MTLSNIYLKEHKPYTFGELKDLFSISDTFQLFDYLKKLKYCGILKLHKSGYADLDNLEDDTENLSEMDENSIYVFTFVGILRMENFLLYFYPKYLTNAPDLYTFKTIIRVLKKYNNSKKQSINVYADTNDQGNLNRLGLYLAILQGYFQYGLYSSDKEIIETNGSGEIHWDKTIHSTIPIIQNNVPYYIELKTKKKESDKDNFFRQLHQCILTLCYEELGETLVDLFEIPPVNLSTETLDDFGDTTYLEKRITDELNIQFNTRKIHLLKAMMAFILHTESDCSPNDYYMYGTNNFNLVWEKVCSCIFQNQLKIPLSEIENDGLKKLSKENDTLMDLIDKPIWHIRKDDIQSQETLEPDIVTIQGNDFYILDAKYYVYQIEDHKITKSPGIQDIIKQYMYQASFQKKLPESFKIHNRFILPIDDESKHSGSVSLHFLSELKLENIEIYHLSVKYAYDRYLNNKTIAPPK